MSDLSPTLDWSLFGKIIYINLQSRKDRKTRMENQLNRLGIPQEKIYRLEAIHHDLGHIGCAKSHAKALEIAITNNWGNIIILEDDFDFNNTKDTTERLSHFLSILSKIQWNGAIFAGNYLEATPLKSTSKILRIYKSEYCSAYAVNATYQPILHQNFTDAYIFLEKGGAKKQFSCDIHWWKVLGAHTWIAAYPSLGHQWSNISDIEGGYMDCVQKYYTPLSEATYHQTLGTRSNG